MLDKEMESEAEFDERMGGIRRATKELLDDTAMFFGHDEDLILLNLKQTFLQELLFWTESDASQEEKHMRIEWEYWNLFNKIVDLINIDDEYKQEEEKDFWS
jgi:uncharacterized protein (DUF952 family)